MRLGVKLSRLAAKVGFHAGRRPGSGWKMRWKRSALCEPVEAPHDTLAHGNYFCGLSDNPDDQKSREPRRLAFYQATAKLIRAYANAANEFEQIGYDATAASEILKEVTFYENVRNEVKLRSRDYVDLKLYEPAMRHLIDAYIRAKDSEKISAFDDDADPADRGARGRCA